MRQARLRAAIVTAVMLGGVVASRAPLAAQDLSRLPKDHPEVTVVGATGNETTGILRRFDASTVTLDLDGKDVVFQQQAIARIYDGDPLKNGMLIGLASGLGLAAATALGGQECGGIFTETRSCTGDEKLGVFGLTGAVFGGAGLGLGAAIDAIVHRHRVLYRTPSGAGASSLLPLTLHLDHGAARASIGFAW